MDPHSYCTEALDELRAAADERAVDADGLRRWSVLAYLAPRRLPADEFVAELTRLRLEATRSRESWLEAAAAAILRDWRARAERTA